MTILHISIWHRFDNCKRFRYEASKHSAPVPLLNDNDYPSRLIKQIESAAYSCKLINICIMKTSQWIYFLLLNFGLKTGSWCVIVCEVLSLIYLIFDVPLDISFIGWSRVYILLFFLSQISLRISTLFFKKPYSHRLQEANTNFRIILLSLQHVVDSLDILIIFSKVIELECSLRIHEPPPKYSDTRTSVIIRRQLY